MKKFKSFSEFRNRAVEQLTEAAGKTWDDGIWRQTGAGVPHILPTIHSDDSRKNRENRAEAIKVSVPENG